MGGGDWNDGMNRVGHEGRGESVWLAWFLGYVLTRFAPVCEPRGEAERAADYRAWADSLAAAAEKHAWDGAWYRRAYFDDGTPLGTRDAEECRIDAIAQAWATISGLGDPERAEQALDAVEEKLVRREDGLIALLAPPFDTHGARPRLHQGLRPGRARERRPVHARRALGRARLPDAGRRRRGARPARPHQPDQPRARSGVRPSATRSSPTWSPPTSTPSPRTPAAADGRGTPARPRGSTEWRSSGYLGLSVLYRDGDSYSPSTRASRAAGERYEMRYRHGSATYHITVENPRGREPRGGARRTRRYGRSRICSCRSSTTASNTRCA